MCRLKNMFIPKVVIFFTILFLIGLKVFYDYTYLFKSDPEFVKLLLSDNPYIENNINWFDKMIYKIPPYKVDTVSFKISEPKVYIYNTHDTEKYLDGNIYEAAKYFESELESIGIDVIVEEGKVSPYLDRNQDTFYQAYAISRGYASQVLATYPNLKLIIDLHRDALEREYSYIKINGTNYAKILFVQGVRYENYEKNLKLVTEIGEKVNKSYPGVSKGVMIKDKSYQHDSYNQDLSTQAMLLELGSNNNYFEEVKNTINILIPIIKEVVDEKSY